jgi:hypothetical protein
MSVQGTGGNEHMSEILSWVQQFNPSEIESTPLLPHNDNSLRMTLIQESWENADIDQSDPGTVRQFYFEDEGLLIVDLNQDR